MLASCVAGFAQEVAATAAPAGTVEIYLAKDDGTGKAGDEATSFVTTDVPIYCVDPIVRRAPALQLTADARQPVAGIPSELAAERGIADGAVVRVTQGERSMVLSARIDASLASNAVRISAAHPLTAALGPMFGRIDVALEPLVESVPVVAIGTV